MADLPSNGPVTIQAGFITITGTEMNFNGEAYVVGGNLHFQIAGDFVIECNQFHVIQHGAGVPTD